MSVTEWDSAADIRSMMRVAGRTWLCRFCCNGAAGGGGHTGPRPDCPVCRGRPRESPLTARKQRLIACGVCRFLGDELTGEPALRAVEVAERFADGQATPRELAAAHEAATAPSARAATLPGSWEAAVAAVDGALTRLAAVRESEVAGDLHAELTQVLVNVEAACGHLGRGAVKKARKFREQRIRDHFASMIAQGGARDARAMAEVMRDVMGDPFRPPRVDPAWVEADGGRVRQVAAAIYEAGEFDELPVLADALQDAGCAKARLLDHCLEGRHYRGCWLLDAILAMA